MRMDADMRPDVPHSIHKASWVSNIEPYKYVYYLGAD